MATSISTGDSTGTVNATIEQFAQQPTQAPLRLKLKNPAKTERKVNWAENTVDNEFLNKKKSKCCCIFEKTRNWDESSSEDENEDHDCRNCRGHRKTDFNKDKHKHNENPATDSHGSPEEGAC